MCNNVFICYESTTGQGYAEHLKKALEKLYKTKSKVFLADITLRGGSDWEENIHYALTDCDFFIVIITALTMDSIEVKKEYDKAIKLDKRIIPVRFSKIDVTKTNELSRLQQITFNDKYELANNVIIELKQIEEQELLDIKNNSYELFKRGNLLFNIGKFNEALILYNQAVMNNANFPEAWANIGLIYSILKNYKKALKAFDEAINLFPDFEDAWLDKGLTLSNLNKPKDALYAFERAIEIDPNFSEAWGAKGSILGLLNRHKEAIIAFNKKIALDPDDYEIWTLKGYGLFNLNRYNEAENAYDTALTLRPDFADALYLKARICAYKKNKKDTIIFLSKAIKCDETFKKEARKDKEFAIYLKDNDFIEITSTDNK